MDKLQELATELHSLRCKNSHIDQCSWEYEDGDWTRPAHEHYLLKAGKLYGTASPDIEGIIEVVKALKGL